MSPVHHLKIAGRLFGLLGVVAGLIIAATAPGHAQADFTLSASPSAVAPGESIKVAWNVPEGRNQTDWIGLYKCGT